MTRRSSNEPEAGETGAPEPGEGRRPIRKGRHYSGPSAERRSSVSGYDRERDATVSTNAAFNVILGVGLGAALGFAIGGETDYSALTALGGAVLGLIIGLAIAGGVGNRPMGG